MKWIYQKIPMLKLPNTLVSFRRLFDFQIRDVSNKPLSPEEAVIMSMSIRKMVVIGLFVVVALFLTSPTQGKDKVKLTGTELKELLLKPGALSVGINHQTDSSWIIEALENGKRSLYWQSLKNPIVWGTDIGTAEISGDQMCSKWTFGERSCFDFYRVGDDKYESYLGESLVATLYGVQREYETRKDKVKLTGAEIEKLYSQFAVFAGVNKAYSTVWMIRHYDGGKRETYWRSLTTPGLSGSGIGTARIVGDKLCAAGGSGAVKCYDIYRVGENKYESWIGGMIENFYYRLK